MWDVLKALFFMATACFKSSSELEAENAALRHQLSVLQRKAPKRVPIGFWDRLILVWLYRRCPGVLHVIRIVSPATVLRWHRTGFRAYWRWKCRSRGGRPRIDPELRALIRRISRENPLWGAPRIHGELLMLGFDVSETTVANYMVKRVYRPGGQSWQTFLRNHKDGIAAMDFVIVPTICFKLLYCLVILRHACRRIVHVAVTHTPTSDWVARQVTEAFPWDRAPAHLIRDRDPVFNTLVRRRLWAMGIRDRPTAPRSPWQNVYAERLIGSIRRECLDHLLIFGERHLRRVMTEYADYYNNVRTHLSLEKRTPNDRSQMSAGTVHAIPHLGGLHHQYVRI